MRAFRFLVVLASLLLPAAGSAGAQSGTIIVRAVKGDSEYFVGTAYLRYVDDDNQVVYAESINPAVFQVDPRFSYSVVLVVAGNLHG